jgi:hypothetical protein
MSAKKTSGAKKQNACKIPAAGTGAHMRECRPTGAQLSIAASPRKIPADRVASATAPQIVLRLEFFAASRNGVRAWFR